MVFQNYALYPHMTVRQNLAFSLMLAKKDKATIEPEGRPRRRDPGAVGADGSLSAPALRRPAPARRDGPRDRARSAGVPFDEPLSNLDAKLRVAMRSELKELHQRLKTTSIYVTHDQIEAMTMGDRIVVMKDGRIEQVGSPLELYDHPANVFVAGFIGSPAMNFLPATLASQRRPGAASSSPTAPGCGRRSRAGGVDGQSVVLGTRPEHLQLASRRRHPVARRRARADRRRHLRLLPAWRDRNLGRVSRAPRFRARQHHPSRSRPAQRAHLFDAGNGARLAA